MVLVILLFVNCADRKEGCLDVLAVNFDVEAETECCCNYPTLNVRINFLNNGEVFSPFDTLTNTIGQSIILHHWISRFHNLQLENSTSSSFQISERIDVNGFSSPFVNDFLQVRTNTFLYPVGTMEFSGLMDSLALQIGLLNNANSIDPNSLQVDHPLRLGSDSLWDASDGYATHHLRYHIIGQSSKEVSIYNDEGATPIKIGYPITFENGISQTIELDLELTDVINGIDFVGDSPGVIRSKLALNFSSALSLVF